MSEEKKDPGEERLLDHSPDGIREYDNPMPRWWLYIFYATIGFSVLYALNVPGIGIGRGRIAEYERDVAEARARAPVTPATSTITEASLLALERDGAVMGRGKKVFSSMCASCHREDAGGLIGPNLTDDYWIHGGRPLEMLKTVRDGVPDKGMPTWSQVLRPDEIAAVVAYARTLHGTHPPNPKEPQGVKLEEEDSGESTSGKE